MSRIYDVEAIRRTYEKTNTAGPPKSGRSRNEKAPLQLRGRGDGIHFSGGGGGSRTRVRKSSAAASTRLVPDLRFASEASRGRDPSPAILCVVSPHPPQEIRIGYPG